MELRQDQQWQLAQVHSFTQMARNYVLR
jgi:hypothetical protein